VDVRGPVMAIDAVHSMLTSFRDLLLGEGRVFGEILGYSTLQIFDMDVRDHLAFFVSGNVTDFVADIHVPVDPGGQTSGRIAAAGFINNRIWRGVFASSLA